ncbi:PREDICTED: defensin-like protein 232 [Camelina sativa]|uniref:Defensin-like protein 232 n=1 Tax=Camelina sativa TaxID=90675 RepID=A0ABM1QM19_CAMSA|nr:PREDICTED: defensin-like protein 232 [Camelina sativa]
MRRCTTLMMFSCVFICLILSHVEEAEAGAPPQDCWDEIRFPGKCGVHGKKDCFKKVESKIKQRVLQCFCNDVERGPNTSKDEHYCSCQRENPYECH